MSDSPTPAERALLERMFTGECTPEEQGVVAELLRRTPEERVRVEAWKAAARRFDHGAHADVDAEVLYHAFLQRVHGEEMDGRSRRAAHSASDAAARSDALKRDDESRRRRAQDVGTRTRWRGVAGLGSQALRRWTWSLGAVATLLGIFFLVRLGSAPLPAVTRSYTTGVNQQGLVTLNDGTHVILAPQTTLRLAEFSSRHRTVSVEGKAYFDVTHATGAPFEVRTGSVTTRVLGTAFLVDHASHSSRVRVAVEEGKVRVVNAARVNADVTITAGNVGEITDSLTTVSAVVDSASGTEWLPGKLVFYNMPVAAVLQTLSRWYGYQFRYGDSTLSQRKVTISVSVRSSASALATLEQILNVSLTMTGDTVTFTPQAERRTKGMSRIRSYDVWTPTSEVGR